MATPRPGAHTRPRGISRSRRATSCQPPAATAGEVVVRRSVVRNLDDDPAAAHQAAVARAFAALDGTARLAPHIAHERLIQCGAQHVSETTPALAHTEEHNDALVSSAFEESLDAPLLTLLGNLNCVPELLSSVRCAAADLTLRRRLVVFQQATGAPPPPAFERYFV